MPFVDSDVTQIIENKRKNDSDFREAWDSSREECRLIGEMISLRKEEKMTQRELAELTGTKQQIISRIEKNL